MNRLLITGASGFVGRQVMPLVAGIGWDVHVVSRDECDLRRSVDAGRLIERVRPTHLLHLAWNAEHGRYWTAPDNDDWAEGTIALAAAFGQQGGIRFVGAGTCAEYDWRSLRDRPCHEDVTPLDPHTPYGRAKLAAWRGVESALAGTGASAAWGRLFLLYGPGEHPDRLVPAVVHALRSGGRAQVTQGTQVRDFLHVADAARAFVALLTSDVTGPVNIASGEAVPLRTVVETLARAAHRSDAVDFGAVPMRDDDPPMIVADIARLLSTGWRQEISLAAGLTAVWNAPP